MDEPGPAARATSPHSGLRRATTERAILDCLAAENGPLTRAELARRTAISPPAISEAVRRMESDAVLVAVGPRSGVSGAVATLYDLAPGTGVVVAVEINRSVVRSAVGDLTGRTLERSDHDPPEDGHVVAARLHEVLDTLAQRWLGHGRPVRAAAVSIANPVDPATGRVVELRESAFPAGVVSTEDVRGVDPSMIVLDNDVNFAALAERDHGAASGTSTFAYLYVGERHSVGMGLVLDGVLVRGARGLAGRSATCRSARARAASASGSRSRRRACGRLRTRSTPRCSRRPGARSERPPSPCARPSTPRWSCSAGRSASCRACSRTSRPRSPSSLRGRCR